MKNFLKFSALITLLFASHQIISAPAIDQFKVGEVNPKTDAIMLPDFTNDGLSSLNLLGPAINLSNITKTEILFKAGPYFYYTNDAIDLRDGYEIDAMCNARVTSKCRPIVEKTGSGWLIKFTTEPELEASNTITRITITNSNAYTNRFTELPKGFGDPLTKFVFGSTNYLKSLNMKALADLEKMDPILAKTVRETYNQAYVDATADAVDWLTYQHTPKVQDEIMKEYEKGVDFGIIRAMAGDKAYRIPINRYGSWERTTNGGYTWKEK